jgi:hypothetical protein
VPGWRPPPAAAQRQPRLQGQHAQGDRRSSSAGAAVLGRWRPTTASCRVPAADLACARWAAGALSARPTSTSKPMCPPEIVQRDCHPRARLRQAAAAPGLMTSSKTAPQRSCAPSPARCSANRRREALALVLAKGQEPGARPADAHQRAGPVGRCAVVSGQLLSAAVAVARGALECRASRSATRRPANDPLLLDRSRPRRRGEAALRWCWRQPRCRRGCTAARERPRAARCCRTR